MVEQGSYYYKSNAFRLKLAQQQREGKTEATTANYFISINVETEVCTEKVPR